MKLSIFDIKDLFIALFGILKNTSSVLGIYFEEERIHIQGMDKSHIGLFDVYISKDWLNSYDKENSCEIDHIFIDSVIFFNIINSAHESHTIHIQFNKDADFIQIDLLGEEKGEFDRFFKIPLADMEYKLVSIKIVDYDAEFTISTKKIYEITGQMINFGTDLNIQCSEEKINLLTTGIHGEMMVNIPIHDLTEYAICEGENINITYNLNYIHKMCISTKLCQELEISISLEYPLKIKYDLGKNSSLVFFIAPKITD